MLNFFLFVYVTTSYFIVCYLYSIVFVMNLSRTRGKSWKVIVQTKLFMYLFVKNYIGTQGEDVKSKSALNPR